MARRRQRIILLGPQGRTVTVGEVLAATEPSGPIATITAGWQEREPEDEELKARLGGRSVNLRLYGRAEVVMEEDPELAQAHHALQESLKLLRRAYNARLSRLMSAWRAVREMAGEAAVLDPEREAALDSVRRLDEAQLARVKDLRQEFEERWTPLERPAVRRQRREVDEQLSAVRTVAIAGGHIAVLLNRLRLFGLEQPLAARSIVAWSAGAMALAERVVLFHDRPPQGPGHAEAFDGGLGLYRGLIPFPHPSRRLALDDPNRLGQLARRFAPSRCLLLDDGTEIEWTGRRWRGKRAARQLTSDGRCERVA